MKKQIMVNQKNLGCPVCGTPAKDEVVMERCLRMPVDADGRWACLQEHCIHANERAADLPERMQEDWCSSCKYNEVIRESGTFQHMKQVGERQWREVHCCSGCHNQYEIESENKY